MFAWLGFGELVLNDSMKLIHLTEKPNNEIKTRKNRTHSWDLDSKQMSEKQPKKKMTYLKR